MTTDNTKKTQKEKNKNITDLFYDRINYNEMRNVFSSNEPFDPANRIYTNQASSTHSVWNSINQNKSSDAKRGENNFDFILDKELKQGLDKIVTNPTIGCKKCGYSKR